MIRTVRPLLTSRRGRLAGVLLVLALVVGVVLMHAMSGSSTRHAAHHAPAAVVVQAHTTPGTTAAAPADSAHAGAPVVQDAGAPSGCGTGGCSGHEMVTAMCLMILAVLLTLVGPVPRALLRAEGPRLVARVPLPVEARPAAGPSLHALGISRT
ncbi:hypothetical protein [Isoptericola nanjingensis]|uniref:hypothetical protein n=1 Tax=Isoptericola TaxID=254250 RepID=UPI0035E48FF3|nr:hypothetical protein [Isoptericola sp. QY 916]